MSELNTPQAKPTQKFATGQKRLLIRMSIGLFTVAALFFGFQYWKEFIKDPDVGTISTKDWIAATEYLTKGSQAVVFQPDGKKISSPDHKDGATEKDIVWRPDGNRLFYVSDRDKEIFQVIRWNLARSSTQVRSFGTRGKARVDFGAGAQVETAKTALLVAGGFVLEFDPKTGDTKQVLPPLDVANAASTGHGESGATNQFDAMYANFGTSFKDARWDAARQSITAIMRHDVGEVLVYQSLIPVESETGKHLPPPQMLIAGNKVEFDIGPNGEIVYSVQDFRLIDKNNIPKEWINKQGELELPFKNGLFVFKASSDPAKPSQPVPILASQKDESLLMKPKFSPDGRMIAVIAGKLDDNAQFLSQRLAIIAPGSNDQANAKSIVTGVVNDFSWSPDGSKLAFTMTEGDSRPIYTIKPDGSAREKITNSGRYAEPRFSPQQ